MVAAAPGCCGLLGGRLRAWPPQPLLRPPPPLSRRPSCSSAPFPRWGSAWPLPSCVAAAAPGAEARGCRPRSWRPLP
eukprot:1084181-Alexandrium_andersonii.AAC.1